MTTKYAPSGPITEAADGLWIVVRDEYNLIGTCALCGKIGGWLRNHVVMWPYNLPPGAPADGPRPLTFIAVVIACADHAPEDVSAGQPPPVKEES